MGVKLKWRLSLSVSIVIGTQVTARGDNIADDIINPTVISLLGDSSSLKHSIPSPKHSISSPKCSVHQDAYSSNEFTIPAREFSEEEIKEATSNFSPIEKLGSGGFSYVYRGYINGTKVAVKKFTEKGAVAKAMKEGIHIPDKFKTDGQLNCEAHALSRCQHKNLVELMGYCKTPPMLMYEYMENGNLHDVLFKKTPVLAWNERSKILKDVCRGLSWLHCYVPPIMHGDVKLRNILIDENLTAKLGDFGFSQAIPELVDGRSLITVALVSRSAGYSAPETDTGHVSTKTDMYSYGVTGHFEEERKSVVGYQQIADSSAGGIAPYLLQVYHKIIENCFKKHSKRCSSSEALMWWSETNH